MKSCEANCIHVSYIWEEVQIYDSDFFDFAVFYQKFLPYALAYHICYSLSYVCTVVLALTSSIYFLSVQT